jgi:predicted phage-related endonuclease
VSAAFEIVCRDTDPEWLAERRKLVTGTVAPQLLGVHRYGSLLSSYIRMRKGAPTQDDVDALNNRETLDWGTDQQESIIRNLRRRLKLDAHPENVLLRSTRHPWAGVTLDGWVRPMKPVERLAGDFPFEVKTTRSPVIAELWADGIPDHVDAQVQHQMLVTDAPKSLVGVTLFGAPPLFIWVDRDEERIGQLIERGEAFWKRVQDGDPPDPDGSEEDDRSVDVAATAGKTVELGIDAFLMTEEIAELAGQRKALEKREKELKQKIRLMMGNAERGNLPGENVGAWKVITRNTRAKLVVKNQGALPMVVIGDRLDTLGARLREIVIDESVGVMAAAKALEGLDVSVKGTEARTTSHIRKVK